MQINILDHAGKVKGKADLPDNVANSGKANAHVLHEVVKAYLANQRKGTHSTLTRSEVSGGGKKPWKQKHTGNARSGSSRSPLWRGGGIIQGPKPRNYRVDLPTKKIKLALEQALLAKAEQGDVVLIDKPNISEPKTKLVASWLKSLSLNGESLLVLDRKDENLARASKNIPSFNWIECRSLHVYHVLNAKKVIFTPEAIKCL